MKKSTGGSIVKFLMLSIIILSTIAFTPQYSICRHVLSPGDDPVPDFKTTPSLRWKVHTNEPILSTPVINQNTVYVGGLDSNLYAIDLQTGKTKWKFHTGGEIRSNTLVTGARVILVGGDGTLYSIEKETGKEKWKWVFSKTAQVLGERKYDIADYFNSSPVQQNNTIYFGSGDGRINAVNAESGELQWTFKTDDIIHGSPALYGNKVFVGSFDGYVYALNSIDGNLLWKFKSVGHEFFPKGEIQGAAEVFNGTVFIGGRDYNLYAINADGGYCNWNLKFPKGWAFANCVKDSVLYVGTSEDRFIAAFDPANGKEIWRTNVGFNIFSPCTFSSTMLYVGNLMGKVFGIDRKTGKIRWSITTDGYKLNHATYFKPDDTFSDQFYTVIRSNVDYINAQLKWGAVFSSPAISKNALVITSTDGTVYCYGQ